MIKNTEQSYGKIAVIFHWLTAFVVFGLFALGLWMVDLTYYSEWYKTAPHIHRSIGLLLALVVIARLIWRKMNLQPQPLSTHSAWEIKTAHLVHGFLYLGLFLMFITGYLISTAKGQAVDIFNWVSIPAIITADQLGINNLEDKMGEIHEILAYILIGIVSLHAIAGLKHHFIDKDSTLLRMLGKKIR